MPFRRPTFRSYSTGKKSKHFSTWKMGCSSRVNFGLQLAGQKSRPKSVPISVLKRVPEFLRQKMFHFPGGFLSSVLKRQKPTLFLGLHFGHKFWSVNPLIKTAHNFRGKTRHDFGSQKSFRFCLPDIGVYLRCEFRSRIWLEKLAYKTERRQMLQTKWPSTGV